MEIVKDMLLVLGGSMLGVTVMCLMNAQQRIEQWKRKESDKMNFGQNLCATRSLVKS